MSPPANMCGRREPDSMGTTRFKLRVYYVSASLDISFICGWRGENRGF